MINKNFNWSISLFLLAGVISGIVVSIIVNTIATPNYFKVFMSQEMFSLMDRREILPYISPTNVIFLLSIYPLFIFIATKNLFNKQNILSTLLISILIIGLVYPLFYIFNYEVIKFDKINYNYPLIGFMLFLALFTIFYIINKINQTQTEVKYILIYSIFYAPLILGFELYLLLFLSKMLNYIEILTNTNEFILNGLIILSAIIIIISTLVHIVIAFIITSFIKNKIAYISTTIIIITILISQYSIYYLKKYDIDKISLNQASNLIVLKNRPKADRILILNKNYSIKKVNNRINTILSFNIKEPQNVDLIPQNIKRLEGYIYNKEFRYYTSSAMEALFLSSLHLWDIDKFREVAFRLIENRASISYSILLFQSAQMLPINDKNRKFLEKLSNRDKFYIPDEYAYSLAKSWISFGDEKRAKEFYNSIIDKDNVMYKDWDTLVRKYRFNSGIISGVINGLSKSSKIALIKNKNNIDFNSKLYNIKDIITTKDKFRFTHLVEGNYMLAILLEDDKNITNVIGTKELKISKNTPIYSDINITIVTLKKAIK